ncbi:hypothetical protein VNI00_004559 [Paramarasmius palmivorus]|uniref:F-box domain-containing protein n=1 Tax=Paramarasmius palmivorus TaxID=297713 RepID=A0AAW0DJZ7_9AGAR
METEEIRDDVVSLPKNDEESAQTGSLKRKTNPPIFRLPLEIIAQIFGYCVPSQHSEHKKLQWLSFTHVCRAWRSIALNDGSLWTCIRLNYHNLAKAMFERSKSSVLDVEISWLFHSTRPNERHLLGEVQRQLHRIRHLRLYLAAGAREDNKPNIYFLSQLSQPAPLLRLLHITGNDFTLPANLLGGEAPLLTHLQLGSCFLSWSSPLLANLIHFELHGPGHINIPTPEQLLDVLRAMPLLETLCLVRMLPKHIPRSEDIQLSKLHTLSLAGDLSGCDGLLSNLVFPETTTFSLECDVEVEDTSSFESLISHFPRIFLAKPSLADTRGEDLRGTKTMCIDLEDDYRTARVVIDAWNRAIPVDLQEHSMYMEELPPCIRLMLRWDHQALSDVEEDLEHIFGSLPMGSVETLHMQCSGLDREEDDTHILVRCLGDLPFISPNLETIVVAGNDLVYRLSCVFQVLDYVDVSTSPPTLAFPALRSLVLLSGTAGCWSRFESTDMTELLHMLRHRLQLKGKRLEVLAARGYRQLDADEVRLLNEVVGELKDAPDPVDVDNAWY